MMRLQILWYIHILLINNFYLLGMSYNIIIEELVDLISWQFTACDLCYTYKVLHDIYTPYLLPMYLDQNY